MKLSFEEIKSVTLGAESVEQESDGIHFHRFTKEQEQVYSGKGMNAEFKQETATSGIRLRFLTDSKALYLKVSTSIGSARYYFSFEVHIDGKFFGSLDNFNGIETPVFPNVSETFGEFEKEFLLPDGEKEVCIYFPWSVCGVLRELSLSDGAFITPVKPKKKILCYGDSITQGYDAQFPSRKYASLLADYLDAEEFNKAVGGDCFNPWIADKSEEFTPEYVIAAYGTNDWSSQTVEGFDDYCKRFYKALAEQYPHSKIFAISPIWRKDYRGERKFGDFLNVIDHIRDAVEPYENITFVPGFNLVEHKEANFRELTLHPNDDGFAQFFENLKDFIK